MRDEKEFTISFLVNSISSINMHVKHVFRRMVAYFIISSTNIAIVTFYQNTAF